MFDEVSVQERVDPCNIGARGWIEELLFELDHVLRGLLRVHLDTLPR
jgi:hypothetical protein